MSGNGGRNTLHVRVQTRSAQRKVEKLGPGMYKVYVHAAPAGGEANREVIAALASHFGVSKSSVRILRGERARDKLVLLEHD